MNKKIIDQKKINELEKGLGSFDLATRKENLRKLISLADEGLIILPDQKDIANLHCHTFFSYNGYGYSPSHIAWLGCKLGAKFMGIIDFDVLDGVDEFLDACKTTGIRGTAGIETRVHIPQFHHVEINSPGEPGVCYHMGTGFSSSSVPDSAEPTLVDLRQRMAQRNKQILNKINHFLSPLVLDFEEDILPLSPSGNVTERHMVQKIAEKSFENLTNPVQFWSRKLGSPVNKINNLIRNPNAFQNTLRKKLMKQGGVAYVQPDEKSFPTLDKFHTFIKNAKALPCMAWLDGTSAGEQAIDELLDLMISNGIVAINIIPDRNWNISDKAQKTIKLKELYRIVSLADKLNLPILVGTEMNSFGQKVIDDFDSPELAPLKDQFINGAYFIYGHTYLERHCGMGYQSDWACKNLDDRKSKNTFYEKAGHLILPKLEPNILTPFINTQLSPELILKNLKQLNKDGKI